MFIIIIISENDDGQDGALCKAIIGIILSSIINIIIITKACIFNFLLCIVNLFMFFEYE